MEAIKKISNDLKELSESILTEAPNYYSAIMETWIDKPWTFLVGGAIALIFMTGRKEK